jgi:transcriptional regulator with XRE-family HTH domain
MSTRKKIAPTKSEALRLLEEVAGEPLKFSNMLLAIRECDELSQTEFSETLGISRQNLCDLEKGRKGISPTRAAKFAKILGYPAEIFVMLAVQEELDREGLKMRVSIEAA